MTRRCRAHDGSVEQRSKVLQLGLITIHRNKARRALPIGCAKIVQLGLQRFGASFCSLDANLGSVEEVSRLIHE
jgi:hypothetical protein